MKTWHWVLSASPALAGLIIALLADKGILIENPVLYVRGSLAALSLRLGIAITVVLTGLVLYISHLKTSHTTLLKTLQSEVREERLRFMQRLDHELKNPLTAIRTGLSNIEQAATEAETSAEVAAVKTQVMRVNRLVADLRKLTTLETLTVEETSVNIGDILTDVVTAVSGQPATAGRSIGLSIPNAPWPLPPVVGDPDLLLLAVHNLVYNAVKFTLPEDAIEIRAYEDGNHVVIEVADTGPGIAENEIEHVWEELYRGKGAGSVPGSGLGLPLVRAIINLHGGQAHLRSRVNQGTVFTLRLPSA